MEALEALADGDDGVRRDWPDEYFASFYDWIPYRGHGGIRSNSAITAEELAVLLEVSAILDDAGDATPAMMEPDEFIATGWPQRIQPVASKALDLLRQRGRFSEQVEEEKPTASDN